MKRNLIKISFLFIFAVLSGCMTSTTPLTDKNSELTQGNVQMNLIVGETSKAQVLENFGSPNITTRDASGKEVWTYQRAAQVSQSSSKTGYWNIIIAGQSGSASGFESSSKMITLIIKFDENDIVYDFKSRESNF
jgi:outer membrane protein assembly factor BamE (lipoprotein component of BamABCDE complex)